MLDEWSAKQRVDEIDYVQKSRHQPIPSGICTVCRLSRGGVFKSPKVLTSGHPVGQRGNYLFRRRYDSL